MKDFIIKYIILSVIVFLFVPNVSGEVILSEVMYNPMQDDTYNEWLEIYNNGSLEISLINWTICEDNLLPGYIKHNESGLQKNESLVLAAGAYAIITDGGSGTEAYSNFEIPNETLSLHTDASSICGGLSNSGETITLFDLATSTGRSYAYPDVSNEGFSAVYVNESFFESNESGGSPGRQNSIKEIQVTPNGTIEEEIDINIGISSYNLSLGETLIVLGNISTTFQSDKNSTLTIKIARQKNETWDYEWYLAEDHNITLTGNTTFQDLFGYNVSWNDTSELIIGNYRILATLEYNEGNSTRYRYSSQEFYVNGLEDLGEEEMTLVSWPKAMRFGDIDKVVVRLDSNNYNFKNASFVAYIYEPRWASIDLNAETLRTKVYSSNTAVRFDNISRGETFYAAIPILTQRNCDGDYESGEYTAKARFYKGEKVIAENEFNITINGKNEAMCPKSDSFKSSSTASLPAAVPAPIEENRGFTYDDTKFDIEIPDTAGIEFDIRINATNKGNATKNFEIWSYAYSGNTALMEREKNKAFLSIEPQKTETFTLKNKITKNDVSGADYKVMVKINSSQRKYIKSFSKDISIDIPAEYDNLGAGEIKSFYTLAKKYQKTISIYAKSECKNQTLVLYTDRDIHTKKCEEVAKFEVEIKEGPNMFFLAIEENGTIKSAKKLLLLANNTDIQSYSEGFDAYGIINSYKSENLAKSQNLLTGQAIRDPVILYESSNIKLKKLIKYFIPTIIILGILVFYMGKKEWKTNR